MIFLPLLYQISIRVTVIIRLNVQGSLVNSLDSKVENNLQRKKIVSMDTLFEGLASQQ